MDGTDTIFTCDIVQQTRFQYVVVALPVVVTILGGVTLGVVVEKLGAPEMARNLITLGSFVGCLIIAIVYMAGGQGRVTLTGSELAVKPRWRSATTIPLPPLEARLEPWIVRTDALTAAAGAMLVVRGPQAEVALAAKDVKAAGRFPSESGLRWLRNPDFVIAAADFSQIVRRLRVAWPDAS